MTQDWQSLAAAGVVLITVGIFVARALKARRKKAAGCGGGCGCSTKPTVKGGMVNKS